MSNREFAHILIDQIPDNKMFYIIAYLQGAAIPDEEDLPNVETQAAVQEVDTMIKTGAGQHFSGSTADFFAQLTAED